MDDLQMIAELGRPVPLPDPGELRPARRRLLAAAASERSRFTAPGMPRAAAPAAGPAGPTGPPTGAAQSLPSALAAAPVRRRRGRQIAVAGGITATAAAGIAAVLVLAPTTTLSPGSPGGGPPARAAAEVLHRAAVAADNEPDVRPRPAQYVYIRSEDAHGVREVWLSVDGTRDGLVRSPQATMPLPGCRNGRQVVVKGDRVLPGVTEPCTPDPAYRPNLPTTAEAMLAYLRGDAGGEAGRSPENVLNSLAKTVLSVSGESYVRPRSRAALYEAAAKLPGMQVIPEAVDGAGRRGMGAAWTYSGGRMTLVFNPSTYVLLGTHHDPPNGEPSSGGTAILQRAIVDRAGQRP